MASGRARGGSARGQPSTLAEPAVHALYHVTVGVRRDDVRIPEHLLDLFGVLARPKEYGRAVVPEVVEPDRGNCALLVAPVFVRGYLWTRRAWENDVGFRRSGRRRGTVSV